MIIKLANNGYIADDEKGEVYVYRDCEKLALYQDILQGLEELLEEHREVLVEVTFSPYPRK